MLRTTFEKNTCGLKLGLMTLAFIGSVFFGTPALASARPTSHTENVARLLGAPARHSTRADSRNFTLHAPPAASRVVAEASGHGARATLWLACLVFGVAWAAATYVFMIWVRAVPMASLPGESSARATSRGRVIRIRDREPAWVLEVKQRAESAAPKSKNYKRSRGKSV